jgi:hypothetical protein
MGGKVRENARCEVNSKSIYSPLILCSRSDVLAIVDEDEDDFGLQWRNNFEPTAGLLARLG